jgi:hypothetical protein
VKAFLHDNEPAGPGEKHGERGPTHCGTITVDYEYQIEQWVIELEHDASYVVRIECPDLGREWKRNESGKFVEVGKAAELPN